LSGLPPLVYRLALLLVLIGAIPISSATPEMFRIVGHTTSLDSGLSPDGFIRFQLSTAGNVSGGFEGTFTFEEWGMINLAPTIGLGPVVGLNGGIMTITTDGGQVRIAFGGAADSVMVSGRFYVLQGTGEYSDLRGQGIYIGNGGFLFAVQFIGTFSRSLRGSIVKPQQLDRFVAKKERRPWKQLLTS
jgi:hypothetical protein